MLSLIVENEALPGVQKVTEKSAKDFKMVYDYEPEICSALTEECIVYATIGYSTILSNLIKCENTVVLEKVSTLSGKRESFEIVYLENPFANVSKMLLVIGSDKRGTIYGIFTLSELIGVSPLVFWGDLSPKKQKQFNIGKEYECSGKEPSVKYRGFFINDEWPCFGNWTFEHFGGFTAKMYDHVFELLLRLKGNTLWPAMWSSSFALDGPGQLNEELADLYGVIMNYSHHEPCLRASEEWDINKGENSAYGTQWDYTKNKLGLLNYWRDGLKRSGCFENIVTLGMRGERDSKMLGVSTLADSINLWKEIITEQNKLIKEYADSRSYTHPRLLAIYKEVEEYFFGDETVNGLCDWEALNDVLLMFCEDNFGFMRRMPEGTLQKHPGGLGMYYHLDYHGDPISYEWINSTPLSKIWEQMTTAYEYGVRDMWMVNVGDLKGNEFPLSYFMAIAYDYEKYGITNLGSAKEYIGKFLEDNFGNADPSACITEGIDLISYRKPESLSPNTYSVSFCESEKMITQINSVIREIEEFEESLDDVQKDGFYSIFGYSLKIGLNNILLNLYSAKNEHYARQGKVVANHFRDLVSECYRREQELNNQFKTFKNSKWSGMELASHSGFTKWNADGAKKPLRYTVEPLEEPHMLVSKPDTFEVACNNYGTPDRIIVDDFLSYDVKKVFVEVANDGIGEFVCKAKALDPVVKLTWNELTISKQELLGIELNEELLKEFKGDSVIVELESEYKILVEIVIPKNRFVDSGVNKRKGKWGVSFLASDADYINNTQDFKWEMLEDYGKYKTGMKIFPLNKIISKDVSPVMGYNFEYDKTKSVSLTLCVAPTNPLRCDNNLRIGVRINGVELPLVSLVSENYKAGVHTSKDWAQGVLNSERRITTAIEVLEGINNLEIFGVDEGVILEKIMIHDEELPYSYFGF